MYIQHVNSDFWRDRRVLITGHTGFKGSWLSLWLQTMGAELRGISLEPPTNPALFTVARVADGMDHQISDVRDLPRIQKLILDFKPEILIHMAAQPLVRLSYQQPVETYSTNVMGTVHVLEAARMSGSVRVIVNVTTDKCYENREWYWGYREDERMGGGDPYSNSKGCAELVSSAYRKSFLQHEKINMATARAGNVVGGGDWAVDRLVPDILRSLERGERVSIRHPNAVRPWQHVLEPLSGYLILAQQMLEYGEAFAEGWNFGPNDSDVCSVSQIAGLLCQSWGGGACWSSSGEQGPHEATYLKLDTSKAKMKLGWHPRWNLQRALAEIVEWHREWIKGADMQSICNSQIASFQATPSVSAEAL